MAALSMAFLAAVVLGFAGVTWQWARAKLETERSRRLLYVSDMNVARQAWEENDVGRVKELLRRHMPLESQDLRGFEWYYLWRLCAVADRAESRKQPGRARRIAVSQATGRLAVGCGNGVVCLWNLKTMQRESLLRTSGSAIHPSEPSRQHPNLMPGWEWLSVAFSPDGQILAYPTADYTGVILQDLRKGTGRSFGGHADIVAAIAFAPDGRFVATGSNDGVVIQHDIQDNTSCELTRCEERVTALAFSTDGSQLAIGAGDGVRILEVSGRGILRSFGEHKDRVWSVEFSPDGKYLASASADHTVIVRNLAAGEYRVLQGHSDEVRSVAFSADGSLLASGSPDDTAALWDIAAGKRIETFKGHSHNVESVAIHQVGDSIRVITGSSDGFVKRWNTGASRTSVLRCKPGVLQVAILPDSRRVVTVDSEQEQVRVWTSENEEWSLTSLSVGKRVHSIAVSSRHLAVGVNDGIRFWRTTDWGEENWRVHTEAVVSALRFSVDGTSIAAGCADGGVLVCQVDAPQFRQAQAGSSTRSTRARRRSCQSPFPTTT